MYKKLLGHFLINISFHNLVLSTFLFCLFIPKFSCHQLFIKFYLVPKFLYPKCHAKHFFLNVEICFRICHLSVTIFFQKIYLWNNLLTEQSSYYVQKSKMLDLIAGILKAFLEVYIYCYIVLKKKNGAPLRWGRGVVTTFAAKEDRKLYGMIGGETYCRYVEHLCLMKPMSAISEDFQKLVERMTTFRCLKLTNILMMFQ